VGVFDFFTMKISISKTIKINGIILVIFTISVILILLSCFSESVIVVCVAEGYG
jgi:hypothetical protein